jgi:hypothetical protein
MAFPSTLAKNQAHAKRVCSERFSVLGVPIGAFVAKINQPLVALNVPASPLYN